jgi:hypothetical protein
MRAKTSPPRQSTKPGVATAKVATGGKAGAKGIGDGRGVDEVGRFLAGWRMTAKPGQYELVIVECDEQADMKVTRVRDAEVGEVWRAWKWLKSRMGCKAAQAKRESAKAAGM